MEVEDKRRGVGGAVESWASAGGGRGRGLWKRTREGRIGVVEENAEQRQTKVLGYSTSI